MLRSRALQRTTRCSPTIRVKSDNSRSKIFLKRKSRFGPLGSFGVEIIAGNDSERQAGSPYGNSKLGGRLAFYAPVATTGQLFASVGSLTSEYDGLFFGVPREDTQLTTVLQVEFRDIWTQGLSLTPRLRYVDNDSTVALYEYDRTEIGLLFRWTPQ